MPHHLPPAPDDPTLAATPPAPGSAGTPKPLQSLPQPETIGPYPILRELGRGGMGVVYLARDPRLERDVALKLLPAELDTAPKSRERFLSEARTLAALNHPNIATIYSLEEAGDLHFLTMELIEGRSLWERLQAAALPIEETLPLMRQVARALEAAHSKGVIHRDLKPSNVMLQEDGTVKVLDFGLAVRIQPDAMDRALIAPATGDFAGTPGYMSPEQIRGEPADPRSDIWALGCILFECLTGKLMIQANTVPECLKATLAFDAAAALDTIPPDGNVSRRLMRLLAGCLPAAATDRFASMRDVRMLLEEEIAERALPRTPETPAPQPEAKPVRGNLPQRLTSFVGRRGDLEATAQLLEQHRMVTILGAGGCGKTRLSQELAARMQGSCPDGTWLVELTPIMDPALVPASAAAALGAQQTAGTSPLDALLGFVRDKSLLILLDNCEHLVDASAALVRRLLDACPNTRILATSREALRVEGEAVYPLHPLAMPKQGGGAAGEDSDAVWLFVDRARAVLPTFHLDDANRAAIHEICRRLDGIPLAIELAAARVKTLPVEKIRDLLDDRFRLLTRGSRSAQPHQSTLRELIDWSYDRLDPQEQAVFRRLSVFRGAWSLEAVEAVAAGGGVDGWDALDLFTRLVEKSLIVRDVTAQGAGSSRYYMYETVRAYAREKLQSNPEEERAALHRHRDYIVAFVAEGELGLRSKDQAVWTVRLADVLADVLAVFDLTAEDPDGSDAGLRLAASYGYQWMYRGMWQDGAIAIARALAHPSADKMSLPYARALLAAGNLAYRMGELDRARGLYQDSLAVLSVSGTDPQLGAVHMNLGNIAYSMGENDAAERSYETSLVHYRRAEAPIWIAGCLTNLSVIALSREELDRLETMQSESLRIYEEAGIRDGQCLALFQLGIAAYIRENYDLAGERYYRALAMAREIESGWNIIAALTNIAVVEMVRGRRELTRLTLVEAAERSRDLPDPILMLPTIETTAWWIEEARPAEAAELLAAATALRRKLKMPLMSFEEAAMEKVRRRLAAALGEDGIARARDRGEALELDAALTDAVRLLAEYAPSG